MVHRLRRRAKTSLWSIRFPALAPKSALPFGGWMTLIEPQGFHRGCLSYRFVPSFSCGWRLVSTAVTERTCGCTAVSVCCVVVVQRPRGLALHGESKIASPRWKQSMQHDYICNQDTTALITVFEYQAHTRPIIIIWTCCLVC